MLNKYITGFGAISVASASAGAIAIAVQNIEETKIHFQGRIFNSEDEVIDYMFNTNFLRVEKENVIGDLQNSYSNYDLGTLHKEKLPTYDPSNTSFAWRMANGMLTDDIEAAKETYFNEGISNILYSDGYGNDFLSQGDAIISAKQNITNTFNPYVNLPKMDYSTGKGPMKTYNPFNENDVAQLKADIDINSLMESVIKGASPNTTGYNIYSETPENTDINIDISSGNQELFDWYQIPGDEQDFSTGQAEVGKWAPNENINIRYLPAEGSTWETYLLDGDEWNKYSSWSDDITTYFKGASFKWHRGTRVTSGTITSRNFNDYSKKLISKPSEIFYPKLSSNESGNKSLTFGSGVPDTETKMPNLDNFTDNEQEIDAKNTIKNELIMNNSEHEHLIESIFSVWSTRIDISIIETSITLELPGSGDEAYHKTWVESDYDHAWWVDNDFGIKRFIEPTIYQQPSKYSVDLSPLPNWIIDFLQSLDGTNSSYSDDDNQEKIILQYDNMNLFEVESKLVNGDVLFELVSLSEIKSENTHEINLLNDDNPVKDGLLFDYNSNNGQDSIHAIHNYYRQAIELDEKWEFDYNLDPDKILHLDNYSYANQLLTSKGRFNPSFSSSTTPITFITSASDYAFQENSFVPTPVAKYVFYDLNGKKIEYSEDAYDSFELMKRNIMRNIYVPKSEEFIFVEENGIKQQIKNEQNSIYRLNIEGNEVFFAEHLKMRNYIKGILQNYVKYL